MPDLKGSKKIRIKDIAQRANVSIGTVDRVLHQRGEVSEETRKKVLKIVNELNYKPNLLARSLASKRKYTIAIVIPDPSIDTPYWMAPLQGLKRAESELKDFNFEFKYFMFDMSKEESFKNQTSLLFKENFDALLFAPVFYAASLEVMKNCERIKIPYIFIDSYLENHNNLSFFGQDSYQSGQLAAKLMSYSLCGKSMVYIFKLRKKNSNIKHLLRREKGFVSYFDEHKLIPFKNINVYDLDVSNNDYLHNSLRTILKGKNDIGGIFVTNSKVNIIANYIEMADIKKPVIIGYDLLQDNVKLLERDKIDFLIAQQPEMQGYKAALTIFDSLFQNKNVEKIYNSPIDIITKENLKYYLESIQL